MEEGAPTAAEFEAKKGADPEVQAMGRIAKLLDALEPAARDRVISWAHGRFCVRQAARD